MGPVFTPEAELACFAQLSRVSGFTCSLPPRYLTTALIFFFASFFKLTFRVITNGRSRRGLEVGAPCARSAQGGRYTLTGGRPDKGPVS